MKKRNKLDNLKPFKPLGEHALAENPLCVKVDPEIDKAIRAMSERSAWLREAIETAAIEQGLIPSKEDITESDRP
ncbi:hypothetical protein H6G81_17880 [Scytonema hofmannii FACHB-248]|uniref:Uncharacterized protein n=2 Tax=Nostocales TaxID=1161 RepID=A0ABR8GSN6_9CYAN|nr:hypothetical protein [Scytonema hofmannii]MBD2606348.1 hypothetical protein [Scytonema hofmannii FACHB-248]